MGISEGITAARAALEVGKILQDKLSTPDVNQEQVRKNMIELLEHVLNAKHALSDADDEIRSLRRQLEDRSELKALETDMEFQQDGGFYIRKSDGVRYCPLCWGQQRKAVPLKPCEYELFACSIHKTSFQTASGKTAERAEKNRQGLRVNV